MQHRNFLLKIMVIGIGLMSCAVPIQAASPPTQKTYAEVLSDVATILGTIPGTTPDGEYTKSMATLIYLTSMMDGGRWEASQIASGTHASGNGQSGIFGSGGVLANLISNVATIRSTLNALAGTVNNITGQLGQQSITTLLGVATNILSGSTYQANGTGITTDVALTDAI